MQLESYSALEANADNVIRDYTLLERRVDAETDTRNGPKTAGELRALQSVARSIAERARALLDHQNIAQLEQSDGGKRARDLQKIAEECELGVAELEAESSPDAMWSRMTDHRKGMATFREPVDNAATARIRDRLQGKLRGQAPPTPQPPRGNPNE